MLHISTISGHERMSTRELLRQIAAAVEQGETEFQISASGQHDIGGPLWNRQGRELRLRVWNPGQRTGSMCLPGSHVIVEGSAPADVGWLNSGGEITVRGDAGDTAGHCAAAGKIYIGGRAGARAGSLMKHDPLHEPPELWILKSTGSFSFEFMGGGRAVVCGHECLSQPSVLGDRPGIGMVGGIVYFRGSAPGVPEDVAIEQINDEDIRFLDAGLDSFLAAIGKPALKKELSIWRHWRKLLPAAQRGPRQRPELAEFHKTRWISGGLFGDILPDDQHVAPLCGHGCDRLRTPDWKRPENCADCRLCIKACPQAAIKRRISNDAPFYTANAEKCIGCGICTAACPSHVWEMLQNEVCPSR